MNNQQRKSYSLLAKTLRWIALGVICNTAAAINAPVQAASIDPDPPLNPPREYNANNIECLFNWAQTFHPNLFSPPVSGVQLSSPYGYRYYPNTDTYLGFSVEDEGVYYLGPEGGLQNVGDVTPWLKTSGCGAVRPYPVIFIHGLASSANTWVPYRDYLINNAYWAFGGIPVYDPSTKTVNINCPSGSSAECTGSAGDFYTLNFSDSQGLSLDVQGGELAAIIKAVLEANPGKTKVLLISHSMGGLAAREYLQGLAREPNSATAVPYRNDVAKLITVGTPHQGSFWAEACFSDIGIPGNVGTCDFNIDPNSIAVQDLKPNSPALKILNDLTAHPLPSDIDYVSIIGTGQSTLISFDNFKDGDGIVSDVSQDLKMLAGNLIQQKSVRIEIPLRECGKMIVTPLGTTGETHTCETIDMGVGAEILKNLQ